MIAELIQRLEDGQGTDREIDKAISEIHYPPRITPDVELPPDFGKIAGVDPGYWGTNYTASIDAALAFAEAMIGRDKMWLDLSDPRKYLNIPSPSPNYWSADVLVNGPRGWAATPARAVLSATLRALQSQEPRP